MQQIDNHSIPRQGAVTRASSELHEQNETVRLTALMVPQKLWTDKHPETMNGVRGGAVSSMPGRAAARHGERMQHKKGEILALCGHIRRCWLRRLRNCVRSRCKGFANPARGLIWSAWNYSIRNHCEARAQSSMATDDERKWYSERKLSHFPTPGRFIFQLTTTLRALCKHTSDPCYRFRRTSPRLHRFRGC